MYQMALQKQGLDKQPPEVASDDEGGKRMKSAWKVTSNYIGRTIYQVFRTIDVKGIDHSGNREYAQGSFDSKEEAQYLADELNKSEENKWKRKKSRNSY